ncbi:MAG: hypothetical protein GY739_19335 [Mesoflavibacter sp.]|nr:hypothetical protein [Mesoflavibacter sp.]
MKFNTNKEFAAMQTYFKKEFKVDIELDGDIDDIEISDEILEKFRFNDYHADYESYTQAIMHYLLNISTALNGDENHKAIFLTQAAVNNQDFCDSVYINTIAKVLYYVGSIVDPENYKETLFGIKNYHPLIIDSVKGWIWHNYADINEIVHRLVGDDSLCDGGNELNEAEELARSQGKIEEYLREFDNNYDNQREVLEKVSDALWAANIEFKEEEETPVVVETPVEEAPVEEEKQTIQQLFDETQAERNKEAQNLLNEDDLFHPFVVQFVKTIADETNIKYCKYEAQKVDDGGSPFIQMLKNISNYITDKDRLIHFAYEFQGESCKTLWDYIEECDRALKEVEID